MVQLTLVLRLYGCVALSSHPQVEWELKLNLGSMSKISPWVGRSSDQYFLLFILRQLTITSMSCGIWRGLERKPSIPTFW